VSQLTDEDVDDMMQLNLKSALYGMQAVLPHMVARKWGHIINMSPPIDLKIVPGKIAYCISKFGMTLISHGLAEEAGGLVPGYDRVSTARRIGKPSAT
jgi:NADP-dependent 3-hydroxy acid dehydrogenase YdfG